ncbi:glycosyltransferase family 4 protein [Flavobacterium sp. 7A]|uniref:glycosyltransferase family 4 protein n=1 Tax=Flavobacterium sp. 7A TaxID=2940571 RepID=UPI0022274159|nr:glycosyltransferase [Flavobacterium sp. 7A]MCW2119461.1 glycosyltransferase involved in cell wall biosynthesis [Flavobacterium sp. 7A]
MKFLIVTHVPHITAQNRFFAYAPYVNEMNIWIENVDELSILAPKSVETLSAIDTCYVHDRIQFIPVANFDFLNSKNSFLAVTKFPKICWKMFKAMQQADHIHLRCPGNIGLLGCFVQILFPNKTKTAKYAGNWDPKSAQPWTYKLQSWLLNNRFLTRKMTVLVYGEWQNLSANSKPFFTATYREAEKIEIQKRTFKGAIKFLFVGTLVQGKNPLYAIQLVEQLLSKGVSATLELYGEGVERHMLEDYIVKNKLENSITLKGNQNREILQQAYQNTHFVLLPSDSEGWPKAIAEGMFWGAVPIATAISCVPYMLDHGQRGILIEKNLDKDVVAICDHINNVQKYHTVSAKAWAWSQQFTMDRFEIEIKKFLQS